VIISHKGSWTNTTPEIKKAVGDNLSTVWGKDSCSVVAAGSRAFHFDGSKWSEPKGFSGLALDLWGSGPAEVWAVGDAIRRFDGATWKKVKSLTNNLRGIWGLAHDDIWAAGYQSSLVHYDGKTWTPSPLTRISTSHTFYAVWGASSSDVHAAGSGVTARYDGTSWKGATTSGSFKGLWGGGASDVHGVGASCLYRRFNGTGWIKTLSGPCSGGLPVVDLWDIHGDGKGQLIAVGNSGVIRRRGPTWSEKDSGTIQTLRAIWGPKGSMKDLVVVTDEGSILWRR
jgi:hypothetical protein